MGLSSDPRGGPDNLQSGSGGPASQHPDRGKTGGSKQRGVSLQQQSSSTTTTTWPKPASVPPPLLAHSSGLYPGAAGIPTDLPSPFARTVRACPRAATKASDDPNANNQRDLLTRPENEDAHLMFLRFCCSTCSRAPQVSQHSSRRSE